jgi:hypothetical protein
MGDLKANSVVEVTIPYSSVSQVDATKVSSMNVI